ncbi:paeninodin family lasso peptide [Bacillus dakarensis]|uniref:paeninodin family lasso peptide n=1 Tax=Robertmurraya dakarensis TaxID=1926278 RepID=UPI00111578FF|nr:paeninodin family lasso peptide [Bacillus dakarensis]
MRRQWKVPRLEVLEVRMTFNGNGNAVPDCFDVGEHNGNMNGNQSSETSNASCKPGLGS